MYAGELPSAQPRYVLDWRDYRHLWAHRLGPTRKHGIIFAIHTIATMSSPPLGASFSVSDLFNALDRKILEQISRARSASHNQNPFSRQVVSPVRTSGPQKQSHRQNSLVERTKCRNTTSIHSSRGAQERSPAYSITPPRRCRRDRHILEPEGVWRKLPTALGNVPCLPLLEGDIDFEQGKLVFHLQRELGSPPPLPRTLRIVPA